MTDFDLDRELSRALREPTEEASPGFTARVVRDLEGRRAPAPWASGGRLLRPALAGAVLLAAGFVVGGLMQDRTATSSQADDRTARIEAREQLRREYRELQEELARIQSLASEQSPVLYLGGDESFDLVYDLAEYQTGRTHDGVRPASLPDRG